VPAKWIDDTNGLSRRSFLRMSGLTAMSAGLPVKSSGSAAKAAPTMIGVPFEKMEPALGIIGTGSRGTLLLRILLELNVKVRAVCDVLNEPVEVAQTLVEHAGQAKPELYSGSVNAYEKLIERDDINTILIATPWEWHVPMALKAMRAGKHVLLEVPAATTIEDCWKLVDASEETRRHCVLLENCCYGYNELMLLNMIADDRFGDLLFAECGYLHDLRDLIFSAKTGGTWRRDAMTKRIGNLYPTHGLGPVANYMRINRGDRFDYMVSMSTPAKGLDTYRKQHIAAGDPKWGEHYVTGDMNTSLIKTVNGLTITLQYDLTNPRPYSRINSIAGTKGIFTDFPPRISLEGQRDEDSWMSIDEWKQKYEHSLWKDSHSIAKADSDHGDMDFVMLRRTIQCMRDGLEPDIDVYDAAAWSAPGPLSAASIRNRGNSMDFPDFTRGKWRTRAACNLTRLG
jgi:hypothetical protein